MSCGPSLRSGKPWGQARGQVHAGLEASADAALHHALPDRRPGPGLYAPGRRVGAGAPQLLDAVDPSRLPQ